MPFLTQGNTNWKFLLIVIILAVIVGGGIWGYLRTTETTKEPSVTEPVIEDTITEELVEESLIEEPELFEIKQHAEQLCSRKIGPVPKTIIISGSFSAPNTEEFLFACENLGNPFSYERYFYIVDVEGDIIVEMKELAVMSPVRYSRPFHVIDINNDGALEIVWQFSYVGGTYVGAYLHQYIYSLKQEELFVEETEIVPTPSGDEEIITVSYSENLENPKFHVFKDYLSSKAYADWHKIHGEYGGDDRKYEDRIEYIETDTWPPPNVVKEPGEGGQWVIVDELVILASGQDIEALIADFNGEITLHVPQTGSYQVRFPVSSLEELDVIAEELRKKESGIQVMRVIVMPPPIF